MTLALAIRPTSTASPTRQPQPGPREGLFLRVMAALREAHIPCVTLHGHQTFPQQISGDVDCLIPANFLPHALVNVLHERQTQIGAKVVQWFTDGSHLVVLAGRAEDHSLVTLQLHISPDFEVGGRVLFTGAEIIEARRESHGFFIPPPDIEFACVLANRLAKRKLTDLHGRRLSALYAQAPQDCYRQAARLFSGDGAYAVLQAARTGQWNGVQRLTPTLWRQLRRRTPRLPSGRVGRVAMKLRRWLRPQNGFHAVFLGPDGVGKSTTIETFTSNLAPVFLHSAYLTFAPGLLPGKLAAPKPRGPHSLPNRSLPASLAKAAWWALCYTAGYQLTIRPTLARGGLVVNHRYLVDAIVDPRRYRYGGPTWLLRVLWAVAPKPHVVFLLDAPAEVIQSRKCEVPFAETAAQVAAYRSVVGKISTGKIIDASKPRAAVADEVTWLVLNDMSRRTLRRLGVTPRP